MISPRSRATATAITWPSCSPHPRPPQPPATGPSLEVPRPTGPYATGRDTLHLTDRSRQDPWVPAAGARQLMVSVHYPARPGSGTATAPYMTTDEARRRMASRTHVVPGARVPRACGSAGTG
ncbi:hypothetical protein ACFU9X_08995 [Streptomyces atratus]|uniref:hypothetical protein n=1 Tax=Streptomyces atratus TaxID=1893 RepID=UPI0036D01E1A